MRLDAWALHDRGIFHHDVSIENAMVDNGRAHIVDMGMVHKVPHHFDKGNQTRQRFLVMPQDVKGKFLNTAPEVHVSDVPQKAKPIDSKAIDVWSAGCVLFCMIAREELHQEPLRIDVRFFRMTCHLQESLDEWDVHI